MLLFARSATHTSPQSCRLAAHALQQSAFSCVAAANSLSCEEKMPQKDEVPCSRDFGGGYMATGGRLETQDRYLVTGACGQLGSALLPFLRERVGTDNVVATDIKYRPLLSPSAGPFEVADVQDQDNLSRICVEYSCTKIIHLASLLSAVGERNPPLTLKINNNGLQNVLELARTHKLQVFSPSTIAVFGPPPQQNVGDDTAKNPTTVYGCTKVHTELLGAYYKSRFGVDFRSLRLPGIIGDAPAGGGTTDYAVDIYRAALQSKQYACYMPENLALPMLYMPDCLNAIWALMKAPQSQLTQTTYNVQGMSVTPRDLANAISEHIQGFEFNVGHPDYRACIAHSWPRSIDDSRATADWGWRPQYDLQRMTRDMLLEKH